MMDEEHLPCVVVVALRMVVAGVMTLLLLIIYYYYNKLPDLSFIYLIFSFSSCTCLFPLSIAY